MANEELKKLFASNLVYWLRKREKTQADVCRYMGVSSATVSDWCNGTYGHRTVEQLRNEIIKIKAPI